MLEKRKTSRFGLNSLLNDRRVRQVIHDGAATYPAADLVAVLTDSEHPQELWADLKRIHPALADRAVVFTLEDGEEVDALDVAGIARLVQSVDSPRAEKLKNWLAQTAQERLEEAENPELALLRTRYAYEQQGYSRQWIDQRMRAVSARHELTGEWYRRGVRDSEEFRDLTNVMMRSAFGMDVEAYRRYKGLFRTGQNLRDHMTDLELALTTLGETAAVELARQRHSSGFDQLLVDAKDTGQVISGTRAEIERQTGRPIVSAMNHLPAGGPRPPRRPGSQARDGAATAPEADAVPARRNELAA
jgi:hypothetical protein